ncbi:MAG TPA: glutamate--tRNA ligase [Candidatus Binatia bacterium]|jgi:glutamyl-tRNA synthetase|nr:glutamate--tRNA ligase [Candidatus Binatia bacterium]
MVRVRFAPSPTGFLHIGGLRTALYNELYALHHGGTFILRIEDTDRTRFVEGAVESLLRTLKRCGIVPAEGPYLAEDGSVAERGDHGPYVQSARLAIYKEHVDKLLASGNAYHCFCTAERLEQVKAGQSAAKLPIMYDRHCRVMKKEEVAAELAKGMPHVVRLAVPTQGATSFEDLIRGPVEFENVLIDDQVLLKSDGFPTYHLANVVDDHLMGITHVIRGEEWLPSTPKHILLYGAFGWTAPAFAHLPLLLNADRSKLSKRQGDVAAEDYLDKGYLPEALVNFIALLGWNPSADREIFPKDELAKEFAVEKINKAGAVFNREKLDWLNKEYLRAMPVAELAERAAPFYAKAEVLRPEGNGFASCLGPGRFTKADLEKAVALEQRRATTLAELPEATSYLFAPHAKADPAMLPGKKGTPAIAKERLEGLRAFCAGLGAEFDDLKALETATLAFVKEKGWTNAESLWPLRVALTGREASPSPFEVAWALGKDRTLARIAEAIASLP